MSNEFKEVTSMEEVEKALKEMRRAWEDICEAFHVDAQIKLQPEVIRNNIRATMMDLNELENMDDTDVTLDLLLTDIQRVFSISNQLNIIKGMESGNLSAETFMSLEDNFIYLGIGIVQTCNGNAVIMGAVVSFIKTLIKINDNILKSISQMLTRQ